VILFWMRMHQLKIRYVTKGSFYDELERVLDQFPKYRIKLVTFQYKSNECRYFQTNNPE